jgi:hypothetical protein
VSLLRQRGPKRQKCRNEVSDGITGLYFENGNLVFTSHKTVISMCLRILKEEICHVNGEPVGCKHLNKTYVAGRSITMLLNLVLRLKLCVLLTTE